MRNGTLYLEYRLNGSYHCISLGTVSNYQDSVNKNTSLTPVVSIGMDNAFPIESGNSRSISISFSRHNPKNYNDTLPDSDYQSSEYWSNRHWYEMLTNAVDRFQLKTNGFRLKYKHNQSEGNVYLPEFAIQGYVKNLTRNYSQAVGELITGSLTFAVGTAYLSGSAPTGSSPLALSQMDTLISNTSRTAWFALAAGTDADAVTSAKLTAGPQDPMEYAVIELSRKKLQSIAPELCGDNALVGYKNEVRLDVMGEHDMILLESPAKSDTTLTLKAVTKAIIYKMTTLSNDISGYPFSIINDLLQTNTSGHVYNSDSIVYAYMTQNNSEELFFPAGDNLYRVMQICAIMLGCNLWFADNKAYLVDFRQELSKYSPGSNTMKISQGFEMAIAHSNASGTIDISDMGGALVGSTEIDGEGSTPLANTVNIVCSSEYGVCAKDKTITAYNNQSISTFGRVAGNQLEVSEICEYLTPDNDHSDHLQATQFGENYLSYIGECQRSKTFTVKELYHNESDSEPMWVKTYPNVARANKIIDTLSGDAISNKSADGVTVLPQKLILSSWTRQYPMGRTSYTFGIISNVDLATSKATTDNSLNTPQ